MKVELHCHTSRYSGCAILSPQEAMRQIVQAGYQAVYITEHDAVWSNEELEELQGQFPHIRIFPGMELALDNGDQHLLVLGSNDEDYLDMYDAEEIILAARSRGHLTVLAHPFRWPGGDAALRGKVLPDALELHTSNHPDAFARQSQEASARLGLPLVNAGDVHAADMIGRFWIETAGEIERATDIRRIVLAGEYKNLP